MKKGFFLSGISLCLFIGMACKKDVKQQGLDGGKVESQIATESKLIPLHIYAPLSYSTYPLINLTDGSLSTIWSVNGKNVVIVTFSMDSVRMLSYIKASPYTGGTKVTYKFGVEVSQDSIAWTRVIDTISTAASNPNLQTFDFTDTKGKYLRIIGYGKTDTTQSYPTTNSYTEMEIWGYPVGAILPPADSLYHPYDTRIKFVGRVDTTNRNFPKFYTPAVYFTYQFTGTRTSIILNDQVLGGAHNYVTYLVDGIPTRIKLVNTTDTIAVTGLALATHTVEVMKGTESFEGYMELVGVTADGLLLNECLPQRKIEFIGDSQTAGSASNTSVFACGTGASYDQEDVYDAYGPVTARALNAQYVVTAESGIALSKINYGLNMPMVFGKMNLNDANSPNWNFSRYVPDIVCINLGGNDGGVDSATFCDAYVRFIDTVKSKYPNAKIVLLSSAMANAADRQMYTNYFSSLVTRRCNIYSYVFSTLYNHGCLGHPSVADQQLIANELTAYLHTTFNW
jgi:hypothetical protein